MSSTVLGVYRAALLLISFELQSHFQGELVLKYLKGLLCYPLMLLICLHASCRQLCSVFIGLPCYPLISFLFSMSSPGFSYPLSMFSMAAASAHAGALENRDILLDENVGAAAKPEGERVC